MTRSETAGYLLILLDLETTGELVHQLGDDIELRLAWGKLLARLNFIKYDEKGAA